MPIPDAVLDKVLDDIAENGNLLCICSAEPATYEQATDTYKLASEVLITGYVESDYSKGAGSPSGRALTIAEQAMVSATATGSATHLAIVDTVAEAIKAVVPLESSKLMISGLLYTVESFTITVREG